MKWLLPVLFIVYYSNVSLFTHVHIVHGTTIVHSHPSNNNADGKCHEHKSLAEIQLFHTLSTIDAADGSVHLLQLHFKALQIGEVSNDPVKPEYINLVRGKLSLRAPPSVC